MGKIDLREVKSSLYKDGNFFEYHFIDITKEEFDSQSLDSFINNPPLTGILSEKWLAELGVDRVVRINGLFLLIRFIDKQRRKVVYEQEMLLFKETFNAISDTPLDNAFRMQKQLDKEIFDKRGKTSSHISSNEITFHNDLCVEINGDYYIRCSKEIGKNFANREKQL